MARQKAIPQRLTDVSKILTGGEPKFDSKATMSNVTRALGWYAAESNLDISKKFFLTAYKDLNLSKEIPAWEFSNTGFLVRMIERGLDPKLVQSHIDRRIAYLQTVSPKYELRKQEEVKEEHPKIPTRDSILDSALEAIDLFVDSVLYKKTVPFEMDLTKYKTSQVTAIRKYLQNYVDEFTGASKKEEYGITTSQEKAIIQGIQKILNVATAVTVKVRKPRKAKLIPASKLVDKLNLMNVFESFKSVPAEKLIGADIALMYNTKTRKVLYVSAMNGGFSVKGKSLTNYTESTVLYKTLRKPTEQLNEFMSMAKATCRKAIDAIKAVNQEFSGRLGGDWILLKVW